jgi:hypothetical protein
MSEGKSSFLHYKSSKVLNQENRNDHTRLPGLAVRF